ncbi:hypothetical protein AABM27_01575 [Heyndrickxia faecalis]|uniref:hypothetical protein n=1 Tax=Heyndrickxia faecalis TaxID=2824910 RepID=UPI0031012A9B
MSAQAVFKRMKDYYLKTGNIMQGMEFKQEILSNFKPDDVIEGLHIFNRFLDEIQVKGGSDHAAII